VAKSRKDKRRRKRKKKRRQRLKAKRQNKGKLQRYKQRLEADLLEGQEVVIEPRGVPKMSEVLKAFVAPYHDLADTMEAAEKLLRFGVMAWNMSFLSDEKQREMLDDLLDKALPEATRQEKEDLTLMMATLIARKKAHFAQYEGYIIDFELTDRGEDYHLAVVAAIEAPES